MTNLEIVYSKRKTLCLQVRPDGTVRVLAPAGISFDKIEEFVDSHKSWLEKSLGRVRQNAQKYESADLCQLKQAAKEYLPAVVEHYANIMNVTPTGIKITSAKTRFGSCNSKNSLCFSCYLMLYPKPAIDYVVVHELAHIRQKNHSDRFYKVVESVMPDYKARRKLLK